MGRYLMVSAQRIFWEGYRLYLGCSFLSHAMMPFSKALAKAELSRSDSRNLASTLLLCLPVRPTGTWSAAEDQAPMP
eukprot:scaffold22393_cov66-Phaeocystis_antarctica.AAC.2